MTHAEFLHQAVAEIAEELPGFDDLDPATQQSLRELGQHYFDDEFVPRLEGIINIPRYEEAMYEKNDSDGAFIADQAQDEHCKSAESCSPIFDREVSDAADVTTTGDGMRLSHVWRMGLRQSTVAGRGQRLPILPHNGPLLYL
jgi:hypothetical protein